jgi:hypothetical protein
MSPERSVERIAIAIRSNGRAIAVYSDGVPFEALGQITAMPRASRVEWDPDVQEWVARDARTGQIVARDRSRETVLRDEHAHYVDVIARGALS